MNKKMGLFHLLRSVNDTYYDMKATELMESEKINIVISNSSHLGIEENE